MVTSSPEKTDGTLDGLGQGVAEGPVEVSEPSPDDPAAVAVKAAIAAGLGRLNRFLPEALAGKEEGVHRMRTTARRLRSALRAFGPLVEEAWSEGLQAELKWLAGALGAVRDLDVQQARLRASAGDLADALTPLFAAMEARHEAARLALGDALRSTRFDALMRRLAEAGRHPEVTDAAREPGASALPPLVAGAWKKLRKAGRGLRPDAPPEAYHQARIRAKRARYAAESVAPALGPDSDDAERFAELATAVQDILGEHQDAVVARDLLESTAAGRPHDVPFALAVGRMIERESLAAERARGRFPKVWDALDRKKLRRWLKSGD